jgi:hypothetical protein
MDLHSIHCKRLDSYSQHNQKVCKNMSYILQSIRLNMDNRLFVDMNHLMHNQYMGLLEEQQEELLEELLVELLVEQQAVRLEAQQVGPLEEQLEV